MGDFTNLPVDPVMLERPKFTSPVMENIMHVQSDFWKGDEGSKVSHLCRDGSMESGVPFGGNRSEGYNG
ncbi:hypothetical protein Hanom_Chr00s056868g01783311 [Helianthus anomalus]